jgi:hypothetical protein
MRRAIAFLAMSTWVIAAQAQSAPPSTSTPPPPPSGSSEQAPATQPPQRGNIAPILDIRIEGEGISLPKPREAAAPEKPPAK